MKVVDWFNKQQVLAQVVVVVIVLYILWQVYLFIDETAGTIGRQTELEILHAQGEVPSFSLSDYNEMAGSLEEAMDGPGTDSEVLADVFGSLVNTTDFIKLDAAFGLRASSYDWLGTTGAVDLKEWINSDLSEQSVSQLNNMLKNKGIKKGF